MMTGQIVNPEKLAAAQEAATLAAEKVAEAIALTSEAPAAGADELLRQIAVDVLVYLERHSPPDHLRSVEPLNARLDAQNATWRVMCIPWPEKYYKEVLTETGEWKVLPMPGLRTRRGDA